MYCATRRDELEVIDITLNTKKNRIEASFSQKRTKYNNMMLVLSLIRKHKQISRIEISEMTGLSASTVSLLIEDLLNSNIVKEVGTLSRNGSSGRKSIILELNPVGGYFMVIEVINTGVIFHLHDLLCERVETLKYKPSDSNQNNASIIHNARKLLNKNKVSDEFLLGINVIYPGIVDRYAQKLIYSVIVPEKGVFCDDDIKALKEEFPGAKFLLTNYSCAVAYAEYIFSEQPDINKTILSVNFIEAVSASAIIVNEKGERIYDFPLEFGHVIVDKDGPLCRCGNRGCLEAVISSSKLFADISEQAGLDIKYSDEFFDASNVQAMLLVKHEMENGNKAVIKKIDETAEIIAFALVNLANIIDPGYIFINGLVILLGDTFISKIKKIFDKHNLKHLEAPNLIYTSTIDNEKRLVSGARMVMDEVFAFSYE